LGGLIGLGDDIAQTANIDHVSGSPEPGPCRYGSHFRDGAPRAHRPLRLRVRPPRRRERRRSPALTRRRAGKDRADLARRAVVPPLGATPTTRIFKLSLGLVGNRQADMRTSAENEWLCAQALAAFGVAVAPCEIRHFGAQKALVVERFDPCGRRTSVRPRPRRLTSSTKPTAAPASSTLPASFTARNGATTTSRPCCARNSSSTSSRPPTGTRRISRSSCSPADATASRRFTTFCPPGP